MNLTFWQFFIDPVLRAPTLGAILMCLASSLIGVIVFIKRRSLIGEALSHASYPGVVLAGLIAAFFFEPSSTPAAILFLVGAFIFALIGLWSIEKLEKHFKIKPDAALSLILSVFLGLGVTFVSRMQMTYPIWTQQIQIFLCGQAATMSDIHVVIYGVLALVMLLFVVLRYRQIETVYFDAGFAESLGLHSKKFQLVTSTLMILALVIGIRSVGIILMASMLIAPATFARQMSKGLGKMFVWSAVAGMVSGFLGVYLSVKLPLMIDPLHPISLPTGPMIVLVAIGFAVIGLLFSTHRGVVGRWMRIKRFKFKEHGDHLLKTLWKDSSLNPKMIQKRIGISQARFYYLLVHLRRGGWIEKKTLSLTADGKRRASELIRLHRLWELYLASELNIKEDRVHASAEEMEHILTPEIERELTQLLKDPKVDPHKQPIPKRDDPLCKQ